MVYQSSESGAATAPVWQLPPPRLRGRVRARDSVIRGLVWAAWPLMSWLLPVFFVVAGFLSGGFAAAAVYLTFPVFVPAMGLLGMLPWFILRRRGHETVPGPVAWLLFVNWWGWIGLTITLPDSSMERPVESMLRRMVSAPLSEDYERGMFAASAIIAAVAWILVLVLALVLSWGARRDAAFSRAEGFEGIGIAAVVVPALLVAAVVGGVVGTAEQQDGAGDTVAQVASMSFDDQVERAGENYIVTQERLSAVRALIADDGWRMVDQEGWSAGRAEFGFEPGRCPLQDVECYTFVVELSLDAAPAGFDESSFEDTLRASGWSGSPHADDSWVDAEGFRLSIRQYPPNNPRLYVEIESPAWWGDEDRLAGAFGTADGSYGGGSFAADEWPPLTPKE